MKKALILLLVLVSLCCAIALTGCMADKNRDKFCYDDKGLFTQLQVDNIDTACREASKKYNVTFLVATTGRNGTKVQLNGEDFLAREGLSQQDDLIIIIINAKDVGVSYHFDIYTYGDAYRRLSDSEIDTVLYSIYADRILTDDSAMAASGVVDMLPMLGERYDGIPLWLNIVLGILLGAAVAGIAVGGVARHYSRKRKNITYPLDKYCRMNLNGHEDRLVHSATTVVVINTNSGGSHGGSRGGGFGGFGGGAGHRGGR